MNPEADGVWQSGVVTVLSVLFPVVTPRAAEEGSEGRGEDLCSVWDGVAVLPSVADDVDGAIVGRDVDPGSRSGRERRLLRAA